MSERTQPPIRRRWPNGLRWIGCFVVVLGLHATAAAALIDHWRAKDEPVANGPVVLIDLAPVAASPAKRPSDVAPAPRPAVQKQPPTPAPSKAEKSEKPAPKPPQEPAKAEEPQKPAVTADLKPAPLPVPVPPPAKAETVMQDIAIPVPRPALDIRKERVRERKHKERLARLAPEPDRAPTRASHATAPRAGAEAHDPDAVPRWKTALVMQLQRYKRYPAEAQEQGVQGVAQLA
ncbi:MAG TPA: hypothetical protein VE224_14735, partial [Pseudolabrys sp.]|nr:hypothetical protein [Pseudolabrys sp.]